MLIFNASVENFWFINNYMESHQNPCLYIHCILLMYMKKKLKLKKKQKQTNNKKKTKDKSENNKKKIIRHIMIKLIVLKLFSLFFLKSTSLMIFIHSALSLCIETFSFLVYYTSTFIICIIGHLIKFFVFLNTFQKQNLNCSNTMYVYLFYAMLCLK